jgi:hypothetical protein
MCDCLRSQFESPRRVETAVSEKLNLHAARFPMGE